MTNGKIIYDVNGLEHKVFNVKDGMGIRAFQKIGGKVAIITGRKSPINELRAGELEIDLLFQNVRDKISLVRKLEDDLKIDSSEMAAIGDDMNDYKMLKYVGFSCCPSDAASQICNIVDHKLSKNGGEGAIREMIEVILEKEDRLDELLKFWK